MGEHGQVRVERPLPWEHALHREEMQKSSLAQPLVQERSRHSWPPMVSIKVTTGRASTGETVWRGRARPGRVWV
jgi:hypothetical protein